MALSAAFSQRLERMESDRNKRLSLLQAEKEVQASKSLELESKLAEIRIGEQRCYVLDQKIATQNFKILALKSEIDALDSKHGSISKQLRVLMIEIEDLEDLEKEKDKFYDSKHSEMKEFKQNAERFASECRMRVKELKNGLSELQSSFVKFQGNNGCTSSEIAQAEVLKSQLLSAKQVKPNLYKEMKVSSLGSRQTAQGIRVNMYEEGDEEMKRSIAKAWSDARSGKDG